MAPLGVSEALVDKALGDAIAVAAVKEEEELMSDGVGSSMEEGMEEVVWSGVVKEVVEKGVKEVVGDAADESKVECMAMLEEGALEGTTVDGSVEARMSDCANVGCVLGGAITED